MRWYICSRNQMISRWIYIFSNNIPVLRPIDFNSPMLRNKFKYKYANTSNKLIDQTSTKLKILLDTYTEDDFMLFKPYKLNTDQLLICIGSQNVLNNAPIPKIIQLLHWLHRSKGINYYKRKEVFDAINWIIERGIQKDKLKPSYAASFAYSLMKMKHTDNKTWFSIADYMIRNKEQFGLRESGTILHSLQKVSDK